MKEKEEKESKENSQEHKTPEWDIVADKIDLTINHQIEEWERTKFKPNHEMKKSFSNYIILVSHVYHFFHSLNSSLLVL